MNKDQTIIELAEKILFHRRAYYNGSPVISDQEYDQLEDQLRELDANHPVLATVGTDPAPTLAKVRHNVPMLSLAKTYDINDLHQWIGSREVMATLKVDGNSLSLIYQDGLLCRAKTRGNGRVGEDVTEKIKWVSDCPKSFIPAKAWEIRGELYCSETQFIKLCEEMNQLGLEKPTNPRNTVAGILGRKAYAEFSRFFNFFAFDVLSEDGASPFVDESEKFQWLIQAGFRVPDHKLMKDKEDVDHFLEFARDFMNQGEVGIDGVVFSYHDNSLFQELGSTSHHPRYRLSFKWQGDTAEAEIKAFTWATSRLGIVTPVAVIEPTFLSGAQITNVTLHNAAHVKLFNLKVGDIIEIVRSGEVIPKFLQVKKSASGLCQLPSQCPSCDTTLEFDDIRLVCPNRQSCPAQQVGSILNWVRCAEIDDLSEKRLIPLIETGVVKHMSDLYKLSIEDLQKVPLVKEKMAKKLFANIQASRQLPLAQFLNGLGIQGAGLVTWENILDQHPTLDHVLRLHADDLEKIDGFAEKTSSQIVSGLRQKQDDISRLLEVGVTPQTPAPDPKEAVRPLAGKTLVITGAHSLPRSEIEALVKKAGGKVASSVSKASFALIIDDINSSSSKAKKARDLGIPLWSEAQLFEALENPNFLRQS